MRILRIIARLNVGGPAKHVVWLTRALNDSEFESKLVTGVVPLGEDDMTWFAEALGVSPTVIPEMSRELSPRDLVTIWKLFQILRREKPDIVHTHTAKAGTTARVAGVLHRLFGGRARFVHTFHGHVFHGYYGAVKSRLFVGIERFLARIATDRIVVLSRQQLEEIHGRYRIGRREQFRIVPLGLEIHEARDPRPEARGGSSSGLSPLASGLRKQLGIRDDEIAVGIVGRLTEVKDHALFLRAAQHFKDAQYVIIGDGHLRTSLEQQARDLGVDDRVSFLGNRNDPDAFYAALDVVALTSRNEGTPLTLIEAMSYAKPVVSTAVGGVVDLLAEERGILVASREPAAFAREVERLARNEGLRRQLGARGRAYVEQQYGLDRLIEDVKQLYRELIESEGREP